MNGNWEVDKVMYDLEWENRNRREIQESKIIPQIHPQTWGKKIFPVFRELFWLIFFLGGKGGVGLSRVFYHVEDYCRWIVVMKISKLSRNMHIWDLVIRLFVESTGLLNSMICQGTYSLLFSLSANLFIQIQASFKLDEWAFDTELEARPLFQHDVERELFVVDKPYSIVCS